MEGWGGESVDVVSRLRGRRLREDNGITWHDMSYDSVIMAETSDNGRDV